MTTHQSTCNVFQEKKVRESVNRSFVLLFFLHDPELIYSVWVFPDQCAVKIVHFCPQRFRSQFRLTNMSEKSLLGAQSIFLISVPALKKNCIRYYRDELLKKKSYRLHITDMIGWHSIKRMPKSIFPKWRKSVLAFAIFYRKFFAKQKPGLKCCSFLK